MHFNTLVLRNVLAVTLGLFLVNCDSSISKVSFEEVGKGCVDGELNCACYGNLTCNYPLKCSVTAVCIQGHDLEADVGSSVTPTGGVDASIIPSSLGGHMILGGATGGFGGSGGVVVDAPGGFPGNGGNSGSGGKVGSGGSMVMDASIPVVPVDAGPDPVLNGACTITGGLNCVGHAQKGMMMCDGTKWVPNGACSGNLICDTSPGPSQGTCVAPIANCANQLPGYSYCTGNTKATCGPDLLTVSNETCPFLCTAGQCSGECVPSSRGCQGQVPLNCSTSGMWLSGTACAGDCNKGICCGVSAPTNCNGSCVDLQSSNANCGACNTVCPSVGGKSCRAGVCQCPAGMIDCSGTCVSLSSSNLHCGACGKACAAGRTCQSSLCACPPGTLECAGKCSNVQTDKENCGSCGIACGDSTCYAGSCGGTNLVSNGDFSDGSTNWQVTQADLGVTHGMSASGYCVSLPAYSDAYFGWGNSLTSLAIAGNYGYTFSYTVSATAPLYKFQAKIGHTSTPYTVVYSTSLDVPGTTPTTFTHSFTPLYSDTSAGIVFYLSAYSTGTTVCFNNVSLVRH